MINQLNKKFWSFKDTSNYNYIKDNNSYMLGKPDVFRIFKFKRAFLLEVDINGENHYTIPVKFVSREFPKGHYIGIGEIKERRISFTDNDIKNIF